jgi:hypothetical protein
MPGSGHVRLDAIGEDSWMRWTVLAAAGVALAAVLPATACSSAVPAARSLAARATTTAGAPATGQQATPEGCYTFAVTALRQHVIVRHVPPVCAGLGAQQVNLAIARAIRTVVGPLHKAAARRRAEADSRYLAGLVRPVRPVRPSPQQAALSPTTSATLSLRLAALAAWVAAASAGAYLLAGLLAGYGRRRKLRVASIPPWVILGHAGLAVTGLCIWIAYTITSATTLAWTDVGLTAVIAGLGMATLLAAIPEQRDDSTQAASVESAGRSSAPFPARAPVVTIVLHGALATLTILLVLLAAVGAG